MARFPLMRLTSKAASVSRRKLLTFSGAAGSKVISTTTLRYTTASRLKQRVGSIVRSARGPLKRVGILGGLAIAYHAAKAVWMQDDETELDEGALSEELAIRDANGDVFATRLMMAGSQPSDENVLKMMIALGSSSPHLLEACHYALDAGVTLTEAKLAAAIKNFSPETFVREVRQTTTLDADKRLSDMIRAKQYLFAR